MQRTPSLRVHDHSIKTKEAGPDTLLKEAWPRPKALQGPFTSRTCNALTCPLLRHSQTQTARGAGTAENPRGEQHEAWA